MLCPGASFRLVLSLPVVNKSGLHHLASFLNDNSPDVISLAVNNGKSPDLISRPSFLIILNVTLNVKLPSRAALLLVTLEPAFLQVVILDSIKPKPSASALQLAEDMIIVLIERPGQLAELRCTFDATSCSLVDVDVCISGLVSVLLDVQGDGCEGDGFASNPANALEGEDSIGVVREGLVL